jgi:hypothetical protein
MTAAGLPLSAAILPSLGGIALSFVLLRDYYGQAAAETASQAE